MAKKIDKEELFERMPVYKAIFTLTIPVIISSVIIIIYNLSDTYFVGMLNDPIQNAAITLAAPAMTLFFAVTNLFGIGASSLMSRKMGTKEYDEVYRASATGLYLGFFCAALLTFITLVFNTPILKILGTKEDTFLATKQYAFWTVSIGAIPSIMNILFGFLLRAEGRSLHASLGTISGCILNIILDPFFILPFGLNLGAAGAGLATFIAHLATSLYFAILLINLKGKTFVSLNPRNFSLKPEILKNIFVVGIPGVFQNFMNVLTMTIMNNMVGAYGTAAVASMGIVGKLNQLPIQVIFGFSQGVMPLIGYNYASGDIKRLKEAIKKTFIITLSALSLIIVLYTFFGSSLVRMFMDNDEIVKIGAVFLKGAALSFPFMCVDFVIIGISQSFGIGKIALSFSFIRKLALEIPCIFLLRHLFGLYGLAFPAVAGEIILSIAALFILKNLLKKMEARQ